MLRTIVICVVLCVAFNQVAARPQTSPARQFSEVTVSPKGVDGCQKTFQTFQSAIMFLSITVANIPYGVYETVTQTYTCIVEREDSVGQCASRAAEMIAETLSETVKYSLAAVAALLMSVYELVVKCLLGFGSTKALEHLVTSAAL